MRGVEENGLWYIVFGGLLVAVGTMIPTYWNPSIPYFQGFFVLVSPAIYPGVGQAMSGIITACKLLVRETT